MCVSTGISDLADKKMPILEKHDFVIGKDVLYCMRCFELI